MRATTAIVATTAFVAVAAIGVTISRVTVDGGPTQLGPAGIVVTAPPAAGSPSADPTHDGAAAPTTGAVAPATGATAPAETAGSPGVTAGSTPPVQTVAPAPARTLPPQAATGKPQSPGKSSDHASH